MGKRAEQSETVQIVVSWPTRAISDDWKIKDVIAIDSNGMAHRCEVVACSRNIVLKRKTR